MKRLRRFIRLPADMRRLLIEAFLLLAFIRTGLWLTSLPRLRQTLKRWGRARPYHGDADMLREKVAWVIHVAGGYLPGTNCLPQALAAQVMLTRLAQPAMLHIGVARDDAGRFKAHAWLESSGHVVVGGTASASQYTALPLTEWKKL